MSSIYDKLKHFEEVILKDAASERDKLLRQVEAQTQERIAIEKKKFEEQADQLLKKEVSLAEIEKNNIISRAIIDSKQLLVKKREEIIDTVFNDTKKLLEEFTQKDEYLSYLSGLIKKSCDIAGDGSLIVHLRKSDIEKLACQLEDIKNELPSDTIFELTDDNIIGGCKVLNKTRDIIIDNTLLGKLKSSRDKILEICDLRIVESA